MSENHLKMITTKINRTIGVLRKLLKPVSKNRLNKAFVRSHLDYGDILYNPAFNFSLHQKLAFNQYRACLVMTGAIRGTSRERIYQELDLELLKS